MKVHRFQLHYCTNFNFLPLFTAVPDPFRDLITILEDDGEDDDDDLDDEEDDDEFLDDDFLQHYDDQLVNHFSINFCKFLRLWRR